MARRWSGRGIAVAPKRPLTNRLRTGCVAAAVSMTAMGCGPQSPQLETAAAASSGQAHSRPVGIDRVIILFDEADRVHLQGKYSNKKPWLESFIQDMPAGNYDASIRSFNDAVSPAGESLSANRDRHATGVHAIRHASEAEPINAALQQIANEWDGRGGKSAIVIITSGPATVADDPMTETSSLGVARDIGRRNGGAVCFHAVLAGDDPAGSAPLEALAALDLCGSFRHSLELAEAAPRAALLRAVFGPDGRETPLDRSGDVAQTPVARSHDLDAQLSPPDPLPSSR